MILFYHEKQNTKNQPYYKGIVFEELLKKYLKNNGYETNFTRIKENSLEYDIKGKSSIQNIEIVGEAKAHESPINAPTFTSFVGKLLPLGLVEKRITGMFLSTSSLTPEADNYLKSISTYNITVKTGKSLQKEIETSLGLPNHKMLEEKVNSMGYDSQLVHVLATNNTTYSLITAGSSKRTEASYFIVFLKNGDIVTDWSFLDTIKNNVKELSSLDYIVPGKRIESDKSRKIQKGLIVGDSVFEYRLPASPKFFVGRKILVETLIDFIVTRQETNIIQIKSRSGVGKSSTLAFIENKLKERGIRVELHDSRDIKSELDIFSIISRFTASTAIPQDYLDIQQQLEAYTKQLGSQISVFMIDQFESTFNKPEIYSSYDSITRLFKEFGKNLVLVIARKNDQITTYDETHISLESINSISKSFILNDFSLDETIDLINKIKAEVGVPVSNDVLSYVKEFSQGFPWLIKRTMSHLINLINKGATQTELIAAGLKLDDLFNEELDGLDELEKSYLYKIASRLPADYNELLRSFDEDPLLPKILDNLTKQKLIRLSGSTYDTYNDVFKEYLVYNKLPEFKNTIIYRQFPNPILMAFHTWVIKKRKFTIEEFTKENGISKGSAFNQLRELTNINILTKKGVKWVVPKQVVDIYDQGRLGEFLRQQLIANDVVSKFINKISSESKIDKLFVLHFLKSEYAFIEANEKSWEYYVNVFLAWLSSSLLITIDKDGFIFRNNKSHDQIVKLLGNMKDSNTYRKRATSNVFLPSVPFKQALEFYKLLIDGKTLNTGAFKKAIGDFKYLNIISSSQDLLVNSVSEFKKVSSVALSVNDFDDLWHEIRNNGNVISTFKREINDSMKESTMLWRIKTLISWGKGLNIIPTKRYQYNKKSPKK